MIRVNALVLFADHGHATGGLTLPAVPRAGDFVILPGFGALAAQVFSVVFAHNERATLQFRGISYPGHQLVETGWTVTRTVTGEPDVSRTPTQDGAQ